MMNFLPQTIGESGILGKSELCANTALTLNDLTGGHRLPNQDSNTRIIHLTQGRETIVDSEDHEWLSQWKWYAKDCKYGKWYAVRNECSPQRTVRMHRVLVNAPEGVEVDHINGNSLDNRKSNLRLASRQENAANRLFNRNNKSGFRGVCKHKQTGKWTAQATVHGKKHYLGVFSDPALAAAAYCDFMNGKRK